MDMNEQLIPVSRVLQGKDSVTLQAGDRLKILTDGTELYNSKVPAGKKWQVIIDMRIEESAT